MMDSEQRQDTESQRDTTPRIMVGSEAGELAVVEARTGQVGWLRRTKCEPGMFVMEGDAAIYVTGMPFAVRKRINSARLDDSIRQQIHVAQEATPPTWRRVGRVMAHCYGRTPTPK